MPFLPLPPRCLGVALRQGRHMSSFAETARSSSSSGCSAATNGTSDSKPQPRGWPSYFNRKSRSEKRMLVRQPWLLPMASQNLAAIIIQRHGRGMIHRLGRDRDTARAHAAGAEGVVGGGAGDLPGATAETGTDSWRSGGRGVTRRRSWARMGRGLGAASQLDKYLAKIEADEEKADALGLDPPVEVGYQTWCATRLQAWARMLLARPRILQARRRQAWRLFSAYHIAAMQLQYMWRAATQRRLLVQASGGAEAAAGEVELYESMYAPSADEVAARVIRRAWRRCTNLRIYRFYRELLAFRNQGDPAQMLRAVNPREAGLLDAAAGVRVRFRLGGARFPPTIYYKIFTCNALCDVGAFAPRDYCAARTEDRAVGGTRLDGNDRGANGGGGYGRGAIRVGRAFFDASGLPHANAASRPELAEADGYPDGWYARTENNGWRPVSIKALKDVEEDPVARLTADRSSKFHYSRLQRRAIVERKRKERQRQWMRHMYGFDNSAAAHGQGHAQAAEPKAKLLHGDSGSAEKCGDDDDELLRWSDALDYDGYVQHWHGVATTAPSDFKDLHSDDDDFDEQETATTATLASSGTAAEPKVGDGKRKRGRGSDGTRGFAYGAK